VPLALVEVVEVAGRNAFDDGWVGSVTKVQIPMVAACAWVGSAAAVAPKECTTALGGTPAWAPKVGNIGGDMVVAGP
jgi:hypothetical protein